MRQDEWRVTWDCGMATVQSLGAMLGPAEFLLPDGRRIQPLAVGEWGDDDTPERAALPGLLRRLRGEWPCVPFGVPSRTDLSAAWSGGSLPSSDPWPHGYGSNHEWSLVAHDGNEIELAIEYPATHPVSSLCRSIRGVRGKAELQIDLKVEMRSSADLPLGLHPVFRLPPAAGQAEVIIEGAVGGRSFPVPLDPSSKARPDAAFVKLDAVPAIGTGTIDFSRLPLEAPNEDLLQVAATAGRVVLRNLAERYVTSLQYESGLFPTVMLWIANCGRADYPWNGRFQALGIEPACAAFDLGLEASADPTNPWRRAGIPTTVRLPAGGRLATSYSIGITDL
ncbi:hypothetical protein [Mesorhizobium sp. CN2-181]|uniref:hypothetical protein n=1 Tax=Mesorhizobium yinganensis TaxID=3157707 RepID=UPI0032B7178F